MKVLIIDDSQVKIERMKKSITSLVPEAKYIFASTYWGAVHELNNETFDFIVCDMQFPIKNNDRIDTKAGIKMLRVMSIMNIEAKIVVASSSDTVGELLEEEGCGHIPTIKAGSWYALDSQFAPHITDFIPYNKVSVSLRDYDPGDELRATAEMLHMGGLTLPVSPKLRTAEDQVNIQKAALKREIKAIKKSKENPGKLKELQEKLKTMGIYLPFLVLFIVSTLGLSGYFERRTITNAVYIDGVIHIKKVDTDEIPINNRN